MRVVIADDQRVVRDGLALVLGLLSGVEVVGTACDGLEALEAVVRTGPDIVLMDLKMPRCDGVEATRRMAAAHPDVTVIVLTTYADDESVLTALQAGARGYLTKDAGSEQIEQALHQVMADHAVIDPAVQRCLVDAIATAAPGPVPALKALTARETEVLTLIAHGLSNAQIAADLAISEATVKSHVNHLLAKLGARDRARAVSLAFWTGLVPG